METLQLFGDYLWVVLWQKWMMVVGFLTAILGSIGFFRPGTEDRIKQWCLRAARYLLLATVFVATFLAYRDMREQREAEHGLRLADAGIAQKNEMKLEKEKAKLEATVERLTDSLKKADQRSDDLADKLQEVMAKRSSTAPDKQPEFPMVHESLRLVSQERISSRWKEAPFGLRLLIQSTTLIQPVDLVVECDAPIYNPRKTAYIGPVGFSGTASWYRDHVAGTENAVHLRLSEPPLRPDVSLEIRLYSSQPISLLGFRRMP